MLLYGDGGRAVIQQIIVDIVVDRHPAPDEQAEHGRRQEDSQQHLSCADDPMKKASYSPALPSARATPSTR